MKLDYNPFSKPFKDIKEADLEILSSVAEGWYVEYKKEKQNPKKIAKSISSFANSYGGIYFLGIESDSQTNFAKNIIGVEDSPDLIQNSVRGNVQPFPDFETLTILLTNKKKVIMAVVPEGQDPPYVNSDGRIYRRQESASDPVYESDRKTMDMLHNKADYYKKKVEEFRELDYTFCKGESTPHLAIFINTKPFNLFKVPILKDETKFSEILDKFNEAYTISGKDKLNGVSLSGKLPLDTLNTYHNSIVLRQIVGRDLAYNGLTIEIDIYGNVKMLIPLAMINIMEENDDNIKEYRSILEDKAEDYTSLNFLDAYHIFGLVMGLIDRYSNFLISQGYKDRIEIEIHLINCWRTAIYFSSIKFFEHIRNLGIPICMKGEQRFPEYPIEIKIDDLVKEPFLRPLDIFTLVSNALGVPTTISLISIFEDIDSKGKLNK